MELRDFDVATMSLAAINALLPGPENEEDPEDTGYKVEINSEKFHRLKANKKMITCQFCKQDSTLQLIKQYEVELDGTTQILLEQKSEYYWNCLNKSCCQRNLFNLEMIKTFRYLEPYYTGVIPSPPVKLRGVRSRSTYEGEYIKWFDIALEEIESKIGIYRAKYLAQQGEDEENFGVQDEGD